MIAIDTNVLLRHVLRDDPAQSEAATAFFASRTLADPVFISVTVIVEFAWTLRRSHRLSTSAIASILRSLLRARDVVVEGTPSVRRALDDAEAANADIADAIIAQRAIDAGCDGVVTFDERALRLPGMLPVA